MESVAALGASADLLCQVLGVVLDETEQGRAPGVLPRQANEIETRRLGHPANVHDTTSLVEHGHVDPRVIQPEAGCPDHGANVERGGVAEGYGRAAGVNRSPV